VSARGFEVCGLGEIAIRCRDLDRMERFCAEVIGLPHLARRAGGIVFFRTGGGHAGHTAVLALFDGAASVRPGLHPGGTPRGGGESTLHHFALAVTPDGQEAAIRWFDRLGQPYRIEEFDWIGWRGLFTRDPEGNTVELVAAPHAVRAKAEALA
ncbi:MAG: VOC family protein, partial [Pseudomonadota bacterium]